MEGLVFSLDIYCQGFSGVIPINAYFGAVFIGKFGCAKPSFVDV
jgi:hypothetical protein